MLGHERTTLIVAVITFVLTALLYILIPKGLFPTQDTGQLQAEVRATQSVSFERMAELQQEVAQTILADPDVASLSSFIGVDAANSTALNTGRMLINLKPRLHRANQVKIMERLRRNSATVAGTTLFLQPVQDLTSMPRPADPVPLLARRR